MTALSNGTTKWGPTTPVNAGTSTRPIRNTTIIYCRHCAEGQLVVDTNVVSIHRSAEGLIGYIRCTAGHLVVHRFTEAYPKPKPPAAVLQLRASLAAAEGAAIPATSARRPPPPIRRPPVQ